MEPLRADDPARIGDYRLVARLGAGAMGRVFLGQGPSGDPVAVKVVHARFAHRQDRRERFAREIAAVRGIDAAYVAPVVDHDASAAEPWLATAYLPGLTLRQVVELHGPLPAPSVRALGAGLARALTAIHRAGVLHRDLKPSNLVLTPDGPRVVDFGIARPDGADTITVPGSLLGTPGYIPPERIRDRRSGREGDVFAFGAVLVYAATGEGPFGAGSAPALLYRTQSEEPRLDALRAAVDDPGLTEIIMSCLARDPRRRPTAEELTQRFTEAPDPVGTRWLPDEVAASVTGAGGPPRPPHAPGGRRTRRTVLALGATGAVLATLGPSAYGAFSAGVRQPTKDRTPLWTYSSPDSGNEHWFTRPTVVGDMVYLSSTMGVHALNCARGELSWTANRGMPVRSSATVLRAGTVLREGTVLFSDGWLWARRATDGSPEPDWQEPWVGITGAPAAGGDQVFLFDTVGYLSAYDGGTGRRRWRLRLVKPGAGGDIDPVRAQGGLDPMIAGGLVYAAPGGVFAVDPKVRAVRWRFGEGTAAPAIHGGLLYTAGADRVHALNAASGAVRWSRDVGARISSGVTVADGLVFAGDDSGRLHALDAATGRPRWRFDTNGPLRAAPAAAPGTVFAGSDNDRLYAITTADGRVRWSHPVGRQTEVHAQVWRDRVLVCGDLTRLYAFQV
ncbi:protein kinase domain-containing protein [Actinomadura sp. HBU206391]|uniref:serine/threonine-protein kinase n=1 Tax=Actinomadura sp. HBU206391 TaxID=2731692 RepID=UPI0016503027|nr:serine/threonine-protein kinase [Actinomadura sp. HBU206391]MBC6458094.1 PQQ-binding-like beta-propeller repeat protein [Actinomadura sp. HBU206391]